MTTFVNRGWPTLGCCFTAMRSSFTATLVALAAAALAPLPVNAADPPPPMRKLDEQSSSAGVVAIPASNPVSLAEADKPTKSDAMPITAAVESGLAHALRLLLDAAAPQQLQEAPETWQKDQIAAEAEFLAEEHLALAQFYATRKDQPVWVSSAGMTEKARALLAALADAAAYGLDPELIPLPARVPLPVQASEAGTAPASEPTPDAPSLALQELALSRAALVYARHARGGRIPKPAEMLNSNLDRKPQLLSPIVVMADLADATDMAAALAKLHPVHPQFEKLRQAYLAETVADGAAKPNAKAKRLRANMEFWRWMWDDLGDLYVFNNIPEFTQTVVRNGEVVRQAKIVVGEIGKQSSVFSRPLKEVVLRPRWRVPESIMVHELWPSLRKGGGLMRQHGLEITTKSGEPRDWREIDWSRDDIRNYHVWQPPGPKSSLGFVKFSFPSQHTIFMHDTPDKWMFGRSQRTLSHGCLRVKDPMQLAEIVLSHDRGWDRDKIKQLIASGPLDNNVEMTKHIPIHVAYFTAWVDDDGKVRFFSDIYGHEKRTTQALDGDWKKINKGRNHLLKPIPSFGGGAIASSAATPSATRKGKKTESVADMISDALGL